MPVLNISDFQIAVDTVQKTEHALGIKDSTGAVYYAPIDVGNCPSSLKVKSGDTVYTVGQSNLYQSVTSIDTCETISLPPGCYKVVVVGGRGGDGAHGHDRSSSGHHGRGDGDARARSPPCALPGCARPRRRR